MVCKSSLCYHRILLALTLIIKYIGDDNMYTIPISSTLVLLVTLLLNWLRILFQALLPYYTSTFAIYPLSFMKYVCNSKASLHLLHTTPQMHMCSFETTQAIFQHIVNCLNFSLCLHAPNSKDKMRRQLCLRFVVAAFFQGQVSVFIFNKFVR